MTFITQVYEQLKTANIVSSGEEFSVRFLKRSPKYYSAIKAQGRDISTSLLVETLNSLSTTRQFLQSRSTSSVTHARYANWQAIENIITAEIALRATANGCLNSQACQQLVAHISAVNSERLVI
jgi:hypothetical protein